MQIIRETRSLCPECLKTLDATVYEKDNAVYIKKTCPVHGEFNDLYWSDYELYKWAEKYYHKGTPIANPQTKHLKDCFFNCGLCDNHKSQTVLAIIDVTSRCNMVCPGCFASSGGATSVYEPTKEQVSRMLETLRANKPSPPRAIQFSGGEPTLRDDLPELVKTAKAIGFEHAEVNTNGLRIAEDLDYFKRLFDAGVSTFYLQFDSLRPEVTIRMRGANFLPQKLKVIENARKIGLDSIVLVVTLAKGINDKDLGSLIEFAVKNSDVIRCVNVQPISFAGRGKDLDPKSHRITVSDFMKLVEEQTEERVSTTDFRPVPWPIPIARIMGAMKGKAYPEFSAAPWCGVATFLVVDKKGSYTPITHFVDVDKFCEAFQKAGEAAEKGHKTKAKLLMLGSLRHAKLGIIKDLLGGVIKTGSYHSLGKFMRRVVMLGAMHFQDYGNLDLYRMERCVIHYATPDPEHPIIPFCSYNSYWRPIIEQKYSTPYQVARRSA